MPYSAEISRVNPSCFLFLIDQSGSMADAFGAGESAKRKAEGVADAINRLLQNLVIKCAKSEGVRDYYHVGVIGYGGSVGPAFQGALARRELIPISEIANSPARVEERAKKVDDGAGALVDQTVKFPVWFDPRAENGTPMCNAMGMAHGILSSWLNQHKTCFPPVVIHITDGESTDGDPSDVMQRITGLSSDDGNVLMFNLHLSSNASALPVTFPDSPDSLPDQYARMLFENSSLLTPFMRSVAREFSHDLGEGARGFVLNADLVMVIQALEIGTRPSNLR
jgi:hypothetical protein